MDSVLTSRTLLGQMQNGENSAWNQFAAIYEPLIDRYLRSKVPGIQKADIDDIRQQVIVVVLKKIMDFEHNGNKRAFRAWLRKILSFVLLNFWRDNKQPYVALSNELLDGLSGPSMAWDDLHDQWVLAEAMQMARGMVCDKEWSAFAKTALEQRSPEEVASELGIHESTVRSYRSRVLTDLKRITSGLVDFD